MPLCLASQNAEVILSGTLLTIMTAVSDYTPSKLLIHSSDNCIEPYLCTYLTYANVHTGLLYALGICAPSSN